MFKCIKQVWDTSNNFSEKFWIFNMCITYILCGEKSCSLKQTEWTFANKLFTCCFGQENKQTKSVSVTSHAHSASKRQSSTSVCEEEMELCSSSKQNKTSLPHPWTSHNVDLNLSSRHLTCQNALPSTNKMNTIYLHEGRQNVTLQDKMNCKCLIYSSCQSLP